jgi:DNA-binding transcriptional regulator WhiA
MSLSINRLVNCEVINDMRSLAYASHQVEHFTKIKESENYHLIEPELIEILEYRLANPELSISELSNEFNAQSSKKLIKSSFYRRLDKLMKLSTSSVK